ncbi:MAG: hypothetical protein ACR2IF_04665 [Terriglobales bacterium]
MAKTYCAVPGEREKMPPMSDSILVIVGVVVAILASFGCVAIMNRAKKRPDAMQNLLDRAPIFGKDFLDRYYPNLPRNLVFEVRSEFARLTGVPADFLLPEDSLAKFAPAGSREAMRGFIAALVSSAPLANQRDPVIQVGEEVATLDDYIRAAVQLCSPEQHSPQAIADV